MHIANLILEYIKVLAWPVLTAFVLWRYRSPIERLIERIVSESEELEGLGFKTKFRGASPLEQANNIQKEVSLLLPTPSSGVRPSAAPALPLAASDFGERYLLAEELVLRALEVRWADAIARHQVV